MDNIRWWSKSLWDIYKKLCDEPKCTVFGEECGSEQGFVWLSGPLSNKNYFIRCKDVNNNQPDPNVCSIIIRPVDLYESGGSISL